MARLRLAQVRQSRGLTKYRLHKITGISISYLSELESGKYRNPRLTIICKLVKALDCSMGELIDCNGEE